MIALVGGLLLHDIADAGLSLMAGVPTSTFTAITAMTTLYSGVKSVFGTARAAVSSSLQRGNTTTAAGPSGAARRWTQQMRSTKQRLNTPCLTNWLLTCWPASRADGLPRSRTCFARMMKLPR